MADSFTTRIYRTEHRRQLFRAELSEHLLLLFHVHPVLVKSALLLQE